MFDYLTPGWRIHNYRFVEWVGTGSFSTVWRSKHTTSGTDVAIKVIQKEGIDLVAFEREVNILKRINHPFLVTLFDMFENEDSFFIVTEYMSNGNLFQYITNNGRLNETQARKIFTQLVLAIEYLHNSKKIVHRDLKLENVVLDMENNIRVIDFGLSNMFTDSHPTFVAACGSPPYASPEMIEGKMYDCSTDIWSIGVMLYSLVTSSLPFDDQDLNTLCHKILYGEVKYPIYLSSSLIDLLKQIFQKDPKERITIQGIIDHPWMRESDYLENIEHLLFNYNCVDEENLNHEIVEKVSSYGVDCTNLIEALKNSDFSNASSLYRMLQNEKFFADLNQREKKDKTTVLIKVGKSYPAYDTLDLRSKVKNNYKKPLQSLEVHVPIKCGNVRMNRKKSLSHQYSVKHNMGDYQIDQV